jgi:hypothetical protein
MMKLLREIRDDPVRLVLYLCYLTAFGMILAGMSIFFGPPYENEPEAFTDQALLGASLVVYGALLAAASWILFEKFWPWLRRQLRLR